MMARHGKDMEGEIHRSILAEAGVEFLLSGEEKVPLSCIEGKTICLFYSANWCRPCRNFTTHLVQLYTTLKTQLGKKLEIVFVSLDRDENSFLDHFKHMPWLAVPFDVNIRKQLSGRLLIEHIPSLIPLAPDGRTKKEDAVQLVEDFGPDAFPFGVERRKELEAVDEAKRHGGKLEELLGCNGRDYVISSDGAKIPIADLVGKTIGLYFGAHWCPPCRTFTSMLAEAYNELRDAKNESFQIIFISTDRDEDEFQSSLEEMPWLAIPYADKTRYDLSRIFDVKGIPRLVLLGADGKVLGTDGRAMISSYGAKAFPFTESRAAEVEAALRKEGEGLPGEVKDSRHQHILKLDVAKAYVCDACRRQGRYWVFSCDRCDFDLHPACAEEIKE
ncbi:probable nucleoredoxin 3 [Elaeis guineensis]|uniref:protein-disulfide reductase n=1 Tax=Elaeis guineensis var. tenera TaxID=51953 RepID=A0A6I9QR92_ELAGV|nr:probable nucleoredoxin 3 [Elaeis guineensis]